MKVVGKLGDKKAALPVVTVSVIRAASPVVTVSVVRRKRGLFVAAKSVKRYIIPDVFFDAEGLLKDAARPVLANVARKVRSNSRWIFLAGRNSYKGRSDWLSSTQLKKQILIASELIRYQGISPERLFVQGIDSALSPYGSTESGRGAVYLYIPVQ